MNGALRFAVFALVVIAMTSAVLGAEQAPFRVVQNETFVVVFCGDLPVLQYRHDGSPYKPYIKELFTPKGVQVLRDAPADHLHHHGVMFAVAADGVTFWTETPQGGRQVPRGLEPPKMETVADCSRVSFTQRLDWVAPDAQSPAIQEKRTIELVKADGLAATVVTWSTELLPAGNRESVELGGEHYYGLGCRLVQSLDKTGRFVYRGGDTGTVVRGKEKVTRSPWCAYVVPAEDAQITVAVFDHPGNPRHPATMFTMPEPFAYLAATLNLWKEPLKLESGQPLCLVYGIALWDGEASGEEIEEAYQKWSLLSGARAATGAR